MDSKPYRSSCCRQVRSLPCRHGIEDWVIVALSGQDEDMSVSPFLADTELIP